MSDVKITRVKKKEEKEGNWEGFNMHVELVITGYTGYTSCQYGGLIVQLRTPHKS